MKTIKIVSRQATHAIDLLLMRQIARCLLKDLLEAGCYELAVHLVGAREMTRINQQFLNHEGSTDVITFDYGDERTAGELAGEIFISVDDAVSQAKEFRATWPEEIIRYLAHGLLHLQGLDDHTPAGYRRMKREETRLLKALSQRFVFGKLARAGKRKRPSRPAHAAAS